MKLANTRWNISFPSNWIGAMNIKSDKMTIDVKHDDKQPPNTNIFSDSTTNAMNEKFKNIPVVMRDAYTTIIGSIIFAMLINGATEYPVKAATQMLELNLM